MRATMNRSLRREHRRVIVLVVLVAFLLIPPIASAGVEGTAIYWNVTAAGGGRVQAAGKSVDYTIGQPFVGVYGGSAKDLQVGFWNSFMQWWQSYMPFVIKGP